MLVDPLLDEKTYSLENGNRPRAYTLEEEAEEEIEEDEDKLNKKLKSILSNSSVFILVRQ